MPCNTMETGEPWRKRSLATLPGSFSCVEQGNRESIIFSVVMMIAVCLEQSSTKRAWRSSLQTLSGAALNRAKWHPNDHHPPLYSVYTFVLYSSFFRASTY